MTELFRYIEHAFPKPPEKEDYINISSDSSFQTTLRDMRSLQDAGNAMKKEAEDYLKAHFSDSDFPISFRDNYKELYNQVRSEKDEDIKKTKKLVESIFDSSIQKLLKSDTLQTDKQLLNDGIAAFKLFPDFEKADAAELVSMRQAIALIETLGATDDDEPGKLKKWLLRPVLIPAYTLPLKKTTTAQAPEPTEEENMLKQVAEIQQEIQDLNKTRRALLMLQPNDMVYKESNPFINTAMEHPRVATAAQHQALQSAMETGFSRINISNQALQNLQSDVRSTLMKFNVHDEEADLPVVINRIEQRMTELTTQIESFLLPSPLTLYRVGVHLFTAQPAIYNKITVSQPLADFSAAVTKPLGIGNLQVVKQELINYEAGEISHIENILEGEKYHRQTERNESIEVTTTQEQETISSEERDLQSTERNEMVSESQKEASKQSVSTKEQTTTTDYGKLVENNKSTYARSITDRVVTSLTEKVKEKRVQKEQRSYKEKTFHQFDNSAGNRKVRGIYQWVNKRYKNRILNYGKRLLYDVTVPEPAAFLLEALKNAAQPESLNIYKPAMPAVLTRKQGDSVDPQDLLGKSSLLHKPLEPEDINHSNYMKLAARYGVASAVEPPPGNFVNTYAKVSSGPGESVYQADIITIPKDYKAISGYFQSTDWFEQDGTQSPRTSAQLFIGKHYFFSMNVLNQGFKMNGETNQLPYTFCATQIKGHTLAIGITCMNESATPIWQLKTYTTIMEGYRKQLAEFEEKLRQLQTTIKAQMMMAQNYAHNSSIERDELKKAFIHLIISEQYGKAFIPSPNPLQFPSDPKYIHKWGSMVSFFERAFEWENMMYVFYPYFWGPTAKWGELILIQDINPQFEEFLKAGAARVVVPVRPGFEAPVAHFQETGEVWMGKQMPDMFSEQYISIIQEINERNFAPGKEQCVAEWEVVLPTSLVMLKGDEVLPEWKPSTECTPNE